MDESRLFDVESIPEVPLFRPPRRALPARGTALDSRFKNDYPADWHRHESCSGEGCPECLWMGSLKARVRLEAGHRCVRCLHPYMPKGDAAMLGVEPSGGQWSPCDERCTHGGTLRYLDGGEWRVYSDPQRGWPHGGERIEYSGQAKWLVGRFPTEAEWRILTVHHLDGNKANCRWWNLAALCQRCHLEIQAKVVIERVYPHEHSEWFKPYAAGWYAWAYLDEDLTRAEVNERLNELLALELTPA
jgi:hypothetical protein